MPFTLSRLAVSIDDIDDNLQFVVTASVLSTSQASPDDRSHQGNRVVLTPLCSVHNAVLVKPLGLVHVHMVSFLDVLHM